MERTVAQIERWIVGAFGFLSGLSVISVPGFTTIHQIRAARNVGACTVFPYSTTWLNALALVVYAWPKQDLPVMGLKFIALIVESFYIYFYIRNSFGLNHIIANVIVSIPIVFAVALVVFQLTWFAHDNHQDVREVAYGWIGNVTAILMYISHAHETYVAWRTNNMDGLSLGLSLAFLANALIWTGYSFIDPFNLYYQVANGTEIVSAAMQSGVWLYCHYYGQQAV